jgi:phage gpG-like protein
MNVTQFKSLMDAKSSKINKYIDHELPIHVGKIAVDHYQDNFRKGGFVNDTLEKWQPAKRLLMKSEGTQYGTLMSSRQELFNSISYIPGDGRVTIRSDKPYSKIQNEGGEIHQNITITPKMRRWAWAMYYKNGGDGGGEAWKALALTKKTMLSRNIVIPKRQFIGQSIALNEKFQGRFNADLEKILFDK